MSSGRSPKTAGSARKAPGVASREHGKRRRRSSEPGLDLQRLAGNEAVGELLRCACFESSQAIPTESGGEGVSGESQEREADHVTMAVMRPRRDGMLSVGGGNGSHDSSGSLATTTPAPGTTDITRNDAMRGSAGEALPEAARSFMEARFGRDLSHVRIHRGHHAASYADHLGARAVTVGADVAFGSGEYRPDTQAGRHLLAHELTHVIQQAGGDVRGPGPVIRERASRSVAMKGKRAVPWEGFVATEESPLMLRTLPDPASEPMGKLPRLEDVTVIRGHRSTWLVVRGRTTTGTVKEGFVLGRFIRPAAEKPEVDGEEDTPAGGDPETKQKKPPPSVDPAEESTPAGGDPETKQKKPPPSVDPKDCPNVDRAIMSWGWDQAAAWVGNKHKLKNRRAVVLKRERKVWKTFTDRQEVDIDIRFRRYGESTLEHVKWRVQPVQKNKQWILESTITDWWDGRPMVFHIADGLIRRRGGMCVIENAPLPPSKPPPPSRDPREKVPV